MTFELVDSYQRVGSHRNNWLAFVHGHVLVFTNIAVFRNVIPRNFRLFLSGILHDPMLLCYCLLKIN